MAYCIATGDDLDSLPDAELIFIKTFGVLRYLEEEGDITTFPYLSLCLGGRGGFAKILLRSQLKSTHSIATSSALERM